MDLRRRTPTVNQLKIVVTTSKAHRNSQTEKATFVRTKKSGTRLKREKAIILTIWVWVRSALISNSKAKNWSSLTRVRTLIHLLNYQKSKYHDLNHPKSRQITPNPWNNSSKTSSQPLISTSKTYCRICFYSIISKPLIINRRRLIMALCLGRIIYLNFRKQKSRLK